MEDCQPVCATSAVHLVRLVRHAIRDIIGNSCRLTVNPVRIGREN